MTLTAGGQSTLPSANYRQTFQLSLLQLAANPADVDWLPVAEAALREAAAAGGQVLVLPELFEAPYFCQTMETRQFDRAQAVPGPTTDHLGKLAAELGVVIVASLFEVAAPGLYYNTTAVLDTDGSYLGKYRKSHIPCDPQYEEKFYFTPGDTGFAVFATRFAKIGVLICWDQWYPEAARLTALKGAEVLVYPTAIGWIDQEGPEEHVRQLEAWQTVQRGHAVANGCFVAAVNRAGREPGPNNGIDFWGHSFCVGPQGEWLAHAGTEPTTVHATIDLQRVRDVRQWWPFLRDRRIDLYGGIEKRILS